jgi:hypothetical protein
MVVPLNTMARVVSLANYSSGYISANSNVFIMCVDIVTVTVIAGWSVLFFYRADFVNYSGYHSCGLCLWCESEYRSECD